VELKCLIQKSSADGEQVVFEVSQCESVEQMEDTLKDALRVCDDRMQEMNERVLDTNELMQTLSQDELVKFTTILDVMYGRASAKAALNRLSIHEEDKQLAKERVNATNGGE